MKDSNAFVLVLLCVCGSFVIAMIMAHLVIRSEMQPYLELEKRISFLEDSVAVQHLHFTVLKDTLILNQNNTICIKSE